MRYIPYCVASDLNHRRGEDLTTEDKCINFMDDHNGRVDNLDYTRDMLSKFDTGSSVCALDSVSLLDADAILSSTCVVLSAASNVASLKFPDMTMQKVLASLERIEGKLTTILKTPLKKAIDTFEFVLSAVRSGNFQSANDKLERLIDNAQTAFHYADGYEMSVGTYRECARAIRILMFGHLLQESYDRETMVFLTTDQLPANKVMLLGYTFERIARKCIEQKKNVKTSSWGLQSDSKKSEAQDILDSILRFAYPHISRAKKLTDMNKHLMLKDLSKNSLQFDVLPELLPMGYEDATQLTLGYLSGPDGNNSTVKVLVWREEDYVRCEYKKARSRTKIQSENESVVMEVPYLLVTG